MEHARTLHGLNIDESALFSAQTSSSAERVEQSEYELDPDERLLRGSAPDVIVSPLLFNSALNCVVVLLY